MVERSLVCIANHSYSKSRIQYLFPILWKTTKMPDSMMEIIDNEMIDDEQEIFNRVQGIITLHRQYLPVVTQRIKMHREDSKE